MDEGRWLTVAEVVDMLRVHEQTVRRWIRDGQLRAYNIGGKSGYRVRGRDLDAFLEGRVQEPAKKVAA